MHIQAIPDVNWPAAGWRVAIWVAQRGRASSIPRATQVCTAWPRLRMGESLSFRRASPQLRAALVRAFGADRSSIRGLWSRIVTKERLASSFQNDCGKQKAAAAQLVLASWCWPSVMSQQVNQPIGKSDRVSCLQACLNLCLLPPSFYCVSVCYVGSFLRALRYGMAFDRPKAVNQRCAGQVQEVRKTFRDCMLQEQSRQLEKRSVSGCRYAF